MAEYIKREALLKEAYHARMFDEIAVVSVDTIKQFPAADVAPVRHGRWVDKKEWHLGRWVAWYECSYCGERDENYEMYEMMPFCSLPNYCPNCGARMDLEVSE